MQNRTLGAGALCLALAACTQANDIETSERGGGAAASDGGAADEEPPLLLGIMVHVETQAAWQDPVYFQPYIDRIREDYLPVLTAHGARFTWEVRGEISAEIGERGDPLFDELLAAGQGVGVHADKGFPTSSQEAFTAELTSLKAGLSELVPGVRHVSGICSEHDWVTAALDAGYAFASGGVAYCLMSLPVAERPAEYADCASPATCHDAYPAAVEGRIHPWRAADGSSWLTPSDTGLVILPSSGGLVCAVEHQAGKVGNCQHEAEDTDLFFQDIELALAARDPERVNAYYLSWSYGALLDLALLEDWLARLEPYLADGRVRWATLGEMNDAYVDWESD